MAYKTDHSPVYIEFSLKGNERGPGYWKIPHSLVYDKEFQARVVDLVKDFEKTNADTDPAVLWDTIQAAIRGLALKYGSELKRKKKQDIEKLEQDIAESVSCRDQTPLPEERKSYDDKIKYMQTELDQVFAIQNQHTRNFNIGRKYYYSERSSKYFLRSKTGRHDEIKHLLNSQEEGLTTDKEILQEGYTDFSKLYRKPPSLDAGNPNTEHVQGLGANGKAAFSPKAHG